MEDEDVEIIENEEVTEESGDVVKPIAGGGCAPTIPPTRTK